MADTLLFSQEKKDEIQRRFSAMGIKEEDLEENFIRGNGNGGQKVNKTSNTVRLTYLPTGLQVRCGQTRSLEVNRWLARRMLIEKILELQNSELSKKIQEREKIRRQKRRRSRRQKAKMLDAKHKNSEKKANRRPVNFD